jgi:transglutaminase-like putative cysteine protease
MSGTRWHSLDAGDPRVTVTAAQILIEGVGLCYAKSHLLIALLRSRGIPAGLCYQRLTDGDSGHMVHGLVAVHLDGGWHRQDPRGNKPDRPAHRDRRPRLVRQRPARPPVKSQPATREKADPPSPTASAARNKSTGIRAARRCPSARRSARRAEPALTDPEPASHRARRR